MHLVFTISTSAWVSECCPAFRKRSSLSDLIASVLPLFTPSAFWCDCSVCSPAPAVCWTAAMALFAFSTARWEACGSLSRLSNLCSGSSFALIRCVFSPGYKLRWRSNYGSGNLKLQPPCSPPILDFHTSALNPISGLRKCDVKTWHLKSKYAERSPLTDVGNRNICVHKILEFEITRRCLMLYNILM